MRYFSGLSILDKTYKTVIVGKMKSHASCKPFYHCVFVEIIILWMLSTDERLFTIHSAKQDFTKGTFTKFLWIYYSLSFVYMSTFSCQLLKHCIFPFSPSKHVTFIKEQSSFFIANVIYIWKFIVQQFSYKDIAEESVSDKYGIMHSDAVQVLMLWKREVGALMDLNIFHINCVNIMINNQLHSLFRTRNVAFS